MVAALIAYDVVYFALAVLLYGSSVMGGLEAARVLASWPAPLAVALGVLAALLLLIAEVGVATALCPALTPGRHPLLKGRVFVSWTVRGALRRLLFLPGLKALLFSTNSLRFLALRALGARVSFTSNFSSDVDLLDPALLEVGPGTIVGARSLVTGHFVQEGEFILQPVVIGRGSLVAADVIVGPGVRIGDKVIVKARVSLAVGVVLEDGCEVNGLAALDAHARIGAKAKVGTRAYVPQHRVVPPGTEWTSIEAAQPRDATTSASSTTSSAAPAV